MGDKLDLPKILCVDDESSVLSALERLLRKDFIILTAESGEQGLNQLRENLDCAVILSDYRMPGMSGIEFLQKAKEIAPNTVRAVLSGQVDLLGVSEAINKAEIHRLILKPWDNDYLRIQMLEAAQSHQTLQERNRLRVQAITDPITQLTNHRYFQERLVKELRRCQSKRTPISVVMIDVDHFKSFNDLYGHPEGDRLLAEVARRIQSNCPTRSSASRYGGEEFALILPERDLNNATEIADEVRKAVEENPFEGLLDKPVYITVSLGVSSYPVNGDTPARLVSAADQALYQAKRQGRNRLAVAK